MREALKVLAAKGLVASRRRAGTHVLPRKMWNLLDPDVLAWHSAGELPPQFLNDLVELRRLVEPAAAAFAATRATPDHRERIRRTLLGMHDALDDLPTLPSADAEFHIAIFNASGNVLIERLRDVLGPLLESSFRVQGRLSRSPVVAVALHDKIGEAILGGNAAAARMATEQLLDIAESEVSEIIAEAGRQAGAADPATPD